MEKELKKAFQNAKYEENQNLALNVWNTISIRNKHIKTIKIWGFSFASLASLVSFIPAWKALTSDLTQSGIYDYFSIIFSNNGSILSYWKELSLSIIESLPTMSIVLSLSLIFVFILSLKYVAKQIIKPVYLDDRSGSGTLSLSF